MPMMDDHDFGELLDRARKGDGAAFEALYQQFNRHVASFAAARRANDPEGVVNEVFLRIFRNLRTFDGNHAQFSAWIFRVTRNLVIDDARRQACRVQETPADSLAEPFATSATADNWLVPGADDIAMSNLNSEALVARLGCLTSEQRDVILLRVVADQSIEVVSATLGKSASAVKSINYRAVRILRESFEKNLEISATSSGSATL